jgi:DNA-binding transcriptional LysR family regulator
MPAVVAAAVKGCGVAYTFESVAKPAIERAELVCLLDQHVIEQPGWFMYFPSRQHMSSRLRSFIDFFRSANSQSRTT